MKKRDFSRVEVSVESVVPGMTAAEVSDATATHTGGDTLVQQQFREESDVNVIVRRFGFTGALPVVSAAGVYGDFSGISDFESALERVDVVERRFMALAPVVRERFGNDPGRLVAAVRSMELEQFAKMLEEPVAPDKPAASDVT